MNELAVFLRDVTKGSTVRELAQCYGIGRTSWSDYRSGRKIIPKELLERVVLHRVRDARGRAELLARARRLHAAASSPEPGRGGGQGDEALNSAVLRRYQEAQRQANADLAESERLVRTLLAITARLQHELDDALVRADSAVTDEPGPTCGPADPEWVRRRMAEAEDCLRRVRVGQETASRTREAARRGQIRHPTHSVEPRSPEARTPAPAEARARTQARRSGDQARPGTELALRGTHLPAVRAHTTALVPDPGRPDLESRRRELSRLVALVGQDDWPGPGAPGEVVRWVPRAPGVRHIDVPSGAAGRAVARLPLGTVKPGLVLLVTGILLALGTTILGEAPLTRAGTTQGPPDGAGPVAVASSQATTAPASSASASVAPMPDRSPTPDNTPAPHRPASLLPDDTARGLPPAPVAHPVQVPSPTGSGVYAITRDGRAVVQWSGEDGVWTRIGGPAGELYAGPAGVFATDPSSGELHGYSGVPGVWATVSGRAAAFAISGTNLYRLAADRSAVHRWDRTDGTWTAVGGPAGKLYGGGAGLFATDPHDGRLFLYDQAAGVWSYAGTAGADFVVGDRQVYALNPDRSAVFRWTGKAGAWDVVGGPASALYPGASDLYATNDRDGGLWRYRTGQWERVGEATSGFGARGEHLYRLEKNGAGVWESRGAAWYRIGGPVRALTVAT